MKGEGVEPVAVFIDYGQLNGGREFAALKQVCNDLSLDEPVVFNFSSYAKNIPTGLTDANLDIVNDAFTPCRNLLFIVTAAAFASSIGASEIVVGLLSEDTALFPDQTSDFLVQAELAIAAAVGKPLKIVTPLRDSRKAEVVALASSLNVKMYYSCHKGGDSPCGRCIACKEYEEIV